MGCIGPIRPLSNSILRLLYVRRFYLHPPSPEGANFIMNSYSCQTNWYLLTYSRQSNNSAL